MGKCFLKCSCMNNLCKPLCKVDVDEKWIIALPEVLHEIYLKPM